MEHAVGKDRPKGEWFIHYHFNWGRGVESKSNTRTDGKLETESKLVWSSNGWNIKGNKMEIGSMGGWWASWLMCRIQKEAVGKIDLVSGTDIIETFKGLRCLWDIRFRRIKPQVEGFLTGWQLEGLKTVTPGQAIYRNWGNFNTMIRIAPPHPSALGIYSNLNTKLDMVRGLRCSERDTTPSCSLLDRMNYRGFRWSSSDTEQGLHP